MKKIFSLLTFLIAFISCDIDDICVEPTTPNLVLRFYDATSTTTLKTTDSLYIWAEGRDTLFFNQVLDSVAIPLDVSNTTTVYNLSKGTLLLNQLTVDYLPEDEFVSRSCGFRVIFNDVDLSVDNPANSWISSITPDNITTINNQNSAHVQVFH